MHIKICRADGGVSLMHTMAESAEDIQTEVEKWTAASGLTAVSHSEIAAGDVPKDRVFREAWTHDLTIDMRKAREIHMGRIRAARDRELARLDIEQLKGRDVTVEKRALRDIPQTFDLTGAATPGDLKALWPTGLPKG